MSDCQGHKVHEPLGFDGYGGGQAAAAILGVDLEVVEDEQGAEELRFFGLHQGDSGGIVGYCQGGFGDVTLESAKSEIQGSSVGRQQTLAN